MSLWENLFETVDDQTSLNKAIDEYYKGRKTSAFFCEAHKITVNLD